MTEEMFSAETLLEGLATRLLRLRLGALDPLDLQEEALPALRGTLGRMLLEHTCPFGRGVCEKGCRFDPRCLYGSLFETPPQTVGAPTERGSRWPHPLVLRPMGLEKALSRGESFDCEFLLFGSFRLAAGTLLEVMSKVGGAGLGRRRGRFQVTAAWLVDRRGQEISVLEGAGAALFEEAFDTAPLSPRPPSNATLARVRFSTPCRLAVHGTVLHGLSSDVFFRAIWRRYRALHDAYGDPSYVPPALDLGDLPRLETRSGELAFADRHRFSHRQSRRIPTGGLLGELVFANPSPLQMELLRLGELLHVGKGTLMGLGRYRVAWE